MSKDVANVIAPFVPGTDGSVVTTNPLKPVPLIKDPTPEPFKSIVDPLSGAADGTLPTPPLGSGLHGPSDPAAPLKASPPPPVAPSPDVPAVQAAMDDAGNQQLKVARSRSATILTSGRGLLGGPTVARRMLLGA